MSYLAMIAVLLVPAMLAFAALRQMCAEQPAPVRVKHISLPRRD